MPYTQLLGGAYQSRSLISAAQRCVNLYPEGVPAQQGEPSAFTHLPTPGLTLLSTAPQEIIRCLYTTSQGDLWACAGQSIYYVDSSWRWHLVGTLTPSAPSDATARNTPVSMVDNGTTLLIADGSLDGWTANLASRSGFARIDYNADPNTGWAGATRVDFSDTFFIANKPGTPIFYVSGSEAATFDPLDFASKAAKADDLVTLIVEHRVIWLLGSQSTEIWFNSGGGGSGSLVNNTFPYESLPNTFFDRGCVAPYSVARVDGQVFWLSQDLTGQGIVLKGLGFNATRVSTHAIEATFSTYPSISDAVAYVYQQQGHTFYCINFPSANEARGATWCFDPQLGEAGWHERAWIDASGLEYRHRANCATNVYGVVVCGDWSNGNLYQFDLNNYTDAGQPIKRLRSFPHMIDTEANRRVFYRQFIANMQCGTSDPGGSPQTVIDTTFTATDGTLLQNYVATGDVGSTYTRIDTSSSAEIMNDVLVGTGGTTSYQASGLPLSPDYSLQYRAVPTDYGTVSASGTNIYGIGRANASHNGYQVMAKSNGSLYQVVLNVMNTATTRTVNLGTLASGYFIVKMDMNGSAITVSVQRSTDNEWLTAIGTWGANETNCIALTDATYSQPGKVLLGGNW